MQFSKVNATAALQLWTNGSDLYGMDWNDCLTKWNGGAWSNLNYYSGTILGAHGDFAARDSVNRNLWFWSYKSSQFRVYSMNTSTAAISEKTLLTQTVTNLYGDQRGNLATMFGRFDDGTTRLLVSIDGGSNWLGRISTMPDLYTTLYWGMDVVILPNGDILLYGGDSGFLSQDQGLTWTRMGFANSRCPRASLLEQRGFGLGSVQLPLRSGAYYLRLSNQSSSVGGLWLK